MARADAQPTPLPASILSTFGQLQFDHGHYFKRACALPSATTAASCNLQIVTNATGQPLASPDVSSGYGPAQFHGAYNLPLTTPAPMTVAIVDEGGDPSAESDLAAYDAQFGLPACTTADGCFRKVDGSGGANYPPLPSDSDWELETALDVEMVHAICENCSIILVETTDFQIVRGDNEAVALGANVVSNSWTAGTEFQDEASMDNSYFKHPGVQMVFASGDDGYGVGWPAASPYVTAVGGTTLNVNGDNSWRSESVWSNSSGGPGSGCSQYEPKPTWQTDSGCANRTVADVSADADPTTGAAVYWNGSWLEVGGTSMSTPIIAGVYGLTGSTANDNYGETPYLYPSALHDITSGSNGSCNLSYLCTAGPGYDGPTGLGSPNGLAAFTAPVPGFTLSTPTPASQAGVTGFTATYAVTASFIGGLNDTINLNVSGLPSSAVATFSPTFLSPSAPTSTLTVTTNGVANGDYTLTITGTDASKPSLTGSTTAILNVQPLDFALTASPASQTVSQGAGVNYTLTLVPSGGFADDVDLSISGASSGGSGITSSITPTLQEGTSSVAFTLTTAASTPIGSYPMTVTGVDASNPDLTHTATVTLVVQTSPPPTPTPLPPASGGGSASSGGSSGGGGGGGGGSAAPNVTLALTAEQTPVVGQALTYDLKVWDELNYGSTWDTLATVVLPNQVTITSVYTPHGSCSFSGQTVQCDLVWLNPGQTVTVFIFTTVASGGSLTATASVSAQGEQPESLSDNNASLTLSTDPPVVTPPTITPPTTLPHTLKIIPLGGGKLAIGSVLTIKPSLKTFTGLNYRWQARGPKGYSNLRSQTAATLRLTAALVGKQVRVIVTSDSQTRISAPVQIVVVRKS
jgi:hypothetical protein